MYVKMFRQYILKNDRLFLKSAETLSNEIRVLYRHFHAA